MLMEQSRPAAVVGKPFIWLSSGLIQAVITVGIGVLLPTLIYDLVQPTAIFNKEETRLSLVLAVTAAVVSVFTLRRMGRYPGISYSATILPTFASTFGMVLALLLILREPYSNTILLIGFLGATAANFILSALVQRRQRLLHYMVPGGKTSRLKKVRNISAVAWSSPDAPIPANAIIVADLHFDLPDAWERRLAEAALAGFPVYHYKQVMEAFTGRVQINHLSENNFGSLIPSNGYHGLKRAIDLVGAVLLLPILLPLLLVGALAVKFDSPGPIFFRQTRVGHRGRQFEVLKFRTMVTQQAEDSDEDADLDRAMTKSDDDRITRSGRWLRRTRIDELPQLWNILRGEMSWIGPRPEAVPLSQWYAREIPFYAYRHIVRPGISGWAQVNQGHVTDLDDINTKLEFDFFYIKNFSYWIDLLVVVRTLQVVFNGFGAK
jgi:exopolysaccharide biosynthesis polyprenyl glycosylphosphotransferase